ncbi:hypothetical protein M8R20_11945 [Pseudomonas sp. R2.Fl]|nr:hypothetical protein [Pseudomonas sp. R2.Fl]
MLAAPLMLIPFVLYNIAVFEALGGGVAVLDRAIVSASLPSAALWNLSLGEVFLLIGLAVLFIDILKATHNSAASLLGHMLSLLVFVAFLAEFLLVDNAATRIFFILTVIAFIDAAGGLAVSVRNAGRDVAIGL